MTTEDVIETMGPVAFIFDELGIPYYVCGSIAASGYGLPRSTNDIDAVAELTEQQVDKIVERLRDAYYADSDAMRNAVRERASFNLIHNANGFKVDVFLTRQRPFDLSAMARRWYRSFQDVPFDFSLWVASKEDVLIAKLERFRETNQTSEHQWRDILGVLKIQGSDLDRTYLAHWSEQVSVADLLARALDEAGVIQEDK